MIAIGLHAIKKILTNEKPTLSREYGVSKVGVFGSYVFGDFHDTSDIDILVEFKRSIGLFAFLKLEQHLSGILGRKVDLVTKTGIKPYLKKDILRSAVYA